MSEQCIFCKIVKGDLPSYTVYEDAYYKAILDINPSAKGHTILIAKQHTENLFALSEETAKAAFVAAQIVATALKTAFSFDGLNVLQNNGEAAGQTVSHFHIHLIPRYAHDGIHLTPATMKLTSDEFAAIQNKIINALENH